MIPESTAINLTINLPKCKFLWFSEDPLPEAVTDRLNTLGIPIITDAGIVLGTPIGVDMDKLKALAAEIVNEAKETFFNALTNEQLPAQHALILLRASGIPRLNYLLRTTPPSVHGDAAEEFDGLVLDAFRRKMDMREDMLTPEVVARIRKRIRSGGVGLPAMSLVSPLAFVSTAAQAAPLVYESIPDGKLDLSSPYSQQLQQHLPTAREAAASSKTIRSLPTEEQEQDFLHFYAVQAKVPGSVIDTDKLQHRLTQDTEQAINRALHQQLKDERRDLELAHANAVTGQWASSLFTTYPSDQSLFLHDSYFRVAVRARILCDPVDSCPVTCACKQPLLQPQTEFHALNCMHVSAKEITDGHNQVVQVLVRLCQDAGAAARGEPRIGPPKSYKRIRPDVLTYMGTETFTVDATIPNPLAPSYRRQALRESSAVAKQAEQKKENKFKDFSDALNADFYPFAVEAFGAFGPSAVKFMHRIADCATNQANPPNRRAFLARAVGAVSMAVHRRLGRILVQAVQHTRQLSFGHAQA